MDCGKKFRISAQLAGFSARYSSSGEAFQAGPGTLEVLAGRDLNLGVSTTTSTNGTGLGITSIGNQSNPYLPFAGSDIIAAAAIGGSDGLDSSSLNFSNSTAKSSA